MKTKQIIEIDTISDGMDAAEMVKNSEFKQGGDIRYNKSAYNVCNHIPFRDNTDIAFLYLNNFNVKKLVDTEMYLWSANTHQL